MQNYYYFLRTYASPLQMSSILTQIHGFVNLYLIKKIHKIYILCINYYEYKYLESVLLQSTLSQ